MLELKELGENDISGGTWVRVAEALAGPNWGSQFTPRIGTEVPVDFIDNDMDRPLVVAQLYTGSDQPPYAAGVDSGVNHAGTLSDELNSAFGIPVKKKKGNALR